MTTTAKLRDKLAELLLDRERWCEQMDAAAKTDAGIDREAAKRFGRRLRHLDMWIESFRAEIRKTGG
jgi:hypothetical protein